MEEKQVKNINNYSIITDIELNSLFEEEEKSKKSYIEIMGYEEFEGLLYSTYLDKRTEKQYAVRETRTVHMGFNSNEDGKIDELIAIVEREGTCKASWGVTGRTAHVILAETLKELLPQYDFEIDYDMYLCKVTKKKEA